MKRPGVKSSLERSLEAFGVVEEQRKALEKLAGLLHEPNCPILRYADFCTCPSDSPANKELQDLAMGFAKTSMGSATDAERLIFAYVLLPTLKRAWQLGHKWFAESDPNLREQAKQWATKWQAGSYPADVPKEDFEDAVFDLLKAIEDKSWMRLSEARTKQWEELEKLLDVKGGANVIARVKALVER